MNSILLASYPDDSTQETGERARLSATPSAQILSKKQWMPKCCMRLKMNSCQKKARSFMGKLIDVNTEYAVEYVSGINKQVRNKIFKAGLVSKKNFQPAAFWRIFCDGSAEKTKYKEDVNTAYKNGFITFHDASFGAKFFENAKNKKGKIKYRRFAGKLRAALHDLYDSPVSFSKLGNSLKDQVHRDKVEALYASYVNKVYNGWADIGYNFVVGRHSGVVMAGRSLEYRGAHAGGDLHHSKKNTVNVNWHNIGVSMGGNSTYDGLSKKAKQSAKHLVSELQARFSIQRANIMTHNHIKGSAQCCMGVINSFISETWNKKVSDKTAAAKMPISEQYQRVKRIYSRHKTGR